MELKEFAQLNDGLLVDLAAEDEYCEFSKRGTLDPKDHGSPGMHSSTQVSSLKTEREKGKCGDAIWENARFWANGRRNLPKSVFLYVELFDPRIQGRPRNSELGGRAVRSSNLSLGFR